MVRSSLGPKLETQKLTSYKPLSEETEETQRKMGNREPPLPYDESSSTNHGTDCNH